MNKKWIKIGAIATGIGLLAFLGKQKWDDLKSNLGVHITRVRVHGLVNTYFLRLVATVRLVNNSTTSIPVNNTTMDILSRVGDGGYTQVAFIPTRIPSVMLKSGETSEHTVDIDINLLEAASPFIAALKGGKVSLRILTKLYVMGIRMEIPYDTEIEIPSSVRSLLSFIPGLGNPVPVVNIPHNIPQPKLLHAV